MSSRGGVGGGRRRIRPVSDDYEEEHPGTSVPGAGTPVFDSSLGDEIATEESLYDHASEISFNSDDDNDGEVEVTIIKQLEATGRNNEDRTECADMDESDGLREGLRAVLQRDETALPRPKQRNSKCAGQH
eukprot:1301071-Rhodomonas_salina.4